MLYAFQMADALLRADAARTILIVGAEAHAGLMPWRDWDILEGTTDRKPTPEAWGARDSPPRLGDHLRATAQAQSWSKRYWRRGASSRPICTPMVATPASCVFQAGFRGHPWTAGAGPDSDSWLIQMEGAKSSSSRSRAYRAPSKRSAQGQSRN